MGSLRLPVSCALVLLCWLSTTVLANPYPDQAPGYDQLISRIERDGRVRVIARFKTAAHNKALPGAVKHFLASRNISPLKQIRRYQLQVFELNRDELAALLESGLYERVVEDRLNSTQLLESMALIGGGLAHNYGLTGNGAAVAVLDNGVDATHPLTVRRWP